MKTKIDRIKELQELLLSEAITKDEFEILKAEILLKNENTIEINHNLTEEKVEKELVKTKLDGFALATLLFGVAGFLSMSETQTIIRLIMGVIAAVISYFRLKDSKEFHGNQIRIAGTVIIVLNALYYFALLGYFG